MLGHIFFSLSDCVDKDIKESLYKNEAYLSTRWGFLEKSIVHWSSYYKKYILLTLLLAVLTVASLVLLQPWIKHSESQYFPNWKNLLDWQGAFLSAQLTIVGVVYPLVVGLVSVFFQNKSAKKVIIPLYQKYSGFMFAGLSGLALSGFIVAGYFSRSFVGDSVYLAICLTSALWLTLNMLLTSWFFVKTFRMLDESSRESIVFRYSIHEAGEIDIRFRYKQALLNQAVHRGLIVNPKESVLKVRDFKFSSDEYKEITRVVKRKQIVKDVRLWLINLAIRMQIWILKLKKTEGCVLVIQPERHSGSSNVVTVARYDGFNMNPLVLALIKIAFSFENEAHQGNNRLSTVLYSFIGPANDAMREGDAREFSDAVDKLVLWHTNIAQTLAFKNSDGAPDNWLLLPVSGMWSRSYFDELLSEYYRLAREAVERIPDNSRFYTDMLYLHKRIYTHRDTPAKNEMRSLIQGSYHMWYLLVEWRSYSSGSNDMRIANKYEDILYDFVGAWESWLTFILPRSKRKVDRKNAYPAFITHLEFTASTAISALRFNNFEAAGWGVDMLINWLDNFSHDEHWDAEYRWRSVLINHYHLQLEPTDAAWQVILKDNEYDNVSAFSLAIKNAHMDMRVMTACYMLLKPGNEQRDLLVTYVKALLSGSRIHPTGSVVRNRNKINHAGELLGCYFRHRDYRSHGEMTYGRWLSSILESFGRIYEERRVSGRIYSGWGANDPRSMKKAYVEIGISMSENIWSLPRDWKDAVMSSNYRHINRKSIISDLRDWITTASEKSYYILVAPEELEILRANFIKSIEGVIQDITEAQNQAVVHAEVDQQRLKWFGSASSAIFKSDASSAFPLSLFYKLNQDADLGDDNSRKLNIVDYAKENVALGIDTNRAINEDEWLAECISNDVKLNILRTLLAITPSTTYEYSDVNNILLDINKLANSMACPVLFVGNQSFSNALHRSFYEGELAKRHHINRQDGFDNDYICHIGRCEVYELPFSDVEYCLLTSKELFDIVGFKRIADDQFVNVSFDLNENSETVGKLILQYWMEVDLAENTNCIKLELPAKEDNSV